MDPPRAASAHAKRVMPPPAGQSGGAGAAAMLAAARNGGSAARNIWRPRGMLAGPRSESALPPRSPRPPLPPPNPPDSPPDPVSPAADLAIMRPASCGAGSPPPPQHGDLGDLSDQLQRMPTPQIPPLVLPHLDLARASAPQGYARAYAAAAVAGWAPRSDETGWRSPGNEMPAAGVEGLEAVLDSLKRILPAFAAPGQADGFQRTLEEASEAILTQVRRRPLPRVFHVARAAAVLLTVDSAPHSMSHETVMLGKPRARVQIDPLRTPRQSPRPSPRPSSVPPPARGTAAPIAHAQHRTGRTTTYCMATMPQSSIAAPLRPSPTNVPDAQSAAGRYQPEIFGSVDGPVFQSGALAAIDEVRLQSTVGLSSLISRDMLVHCSAHSGHIASISAPLVPSLAREPQCHIAKRRLAA